MGKIFNQSLVPSETVYDGRLLDPREMRPDPVLNGRVELPEIDKFYADFLNPKIGQLQPITIKKVDGLPIIVDGVTRWRAALKITEEGQGYKDGVFMLKCQYFVAKSPVDYFVATI